MTFDRRSLSLVLLAMPAISALGSCAPYAQPQGHRQRFRQVTRPMQPTIEPGSIVTVELDAATPTGLQLASGDLAAFKSPILGGVVIFRLIGLPGENIDGDGAFIEGIEIKSEDADAAPRNLSHYFDGTEPAAWIRDARIVRETLPNGVSFLTLLTRAKDDYPAKPRISPVTVPPDQLFLLGDSRSNANDSRYELGMLPMTQVIGRVSAVLTRGQRSVHSARSAS